MSTARAEVVDGETSAGTATYCLRGLLKLHAPVVIKVLRMNLAPKRAKEVADGLAHLVGRMPAHPALAVPLASGLDEGEPYLVSTFTPGDSLEAALRDYGPAAIEDLVPRLRLLAEALDRAAQAGFVHGSLHPRDIVVSTDATRLGGVGVAPLVARSGVAIPRRKPYMAPEIAGGSDPSAPADQFALAALTFEWLFGQRLDGPAKSRVDVPSLPGVDGDALSGAFTTALAPDPAARFENCEAFADAVSASVIGATASVGATASGGKPSGLPDPVASASAREPVAPVPVAWQPSAQPAKEPERWGNGMLVLTLAVGLIFGFAAGYMARPRALQHPMLARPIDQTAPVSAPAPAPAPSALAPAPSALAPAPSAPAPPGRILVRSTPSGASVMVDGTLRGVTPLALRDLELGARVVNIAQRGYVTAEQRVMLTRTRPSRSLEVRLTTVANAGGAKPSGLPGAVGKPKGLPPPTPTPAPTTGGGKPLGLPAAMGSITVDSRPPGANVTVDGKLIGVTPVTLDAISAGEHVVTIILKGYQPFSTTVRVVAGERARAAASLSAQEQE
ncbi:MAG: PEGA domain-containing protein [Vicinamibacterales bacterium]